MPENLLLLDSETLVQHNVHFWPYNVEDEDNPSTCRKFGSHVKNVCLHSWTMWNWDLEKLEQNVQKYQKYLGHLWTWNIQISFLGLFSRHQNGFVTMRRIAVWDLLGLGDSKTILCEVQLALWCSIKFRILSGYLFQNWSIIQEWKLIAWPRL